MARGPLSNAIHGACMSVEQEPAGLHPVTSPGDPVSTKIIEIFIFLMDITGVILVLWVWCNV